MILKFLFFAMSVMLLLQWRQPREDHLGLDLRVFPKGIVNQYDEERDFLKYHRCSNEGEAFAGSWLVTKEHLTAYNVSYGLSEANAELAFFLVMETRRSKKAWVPVGALMQTLDVLDLSVIHLSAYERLYRQYTYDLQEPAVSDEIKGSMSHVVERIRAIARRRSIVPTASSPLFDRHTMSFKDTFQWLLGRPLPNQSSTPSPRTSTFKAEPQPRARRTLAMLPWLGSSKGVGHSETTFRLLYLEACFWSVTQVTPHIVVGVTTKQDHDLVTGAGLPALDIVVLADLPSPQALPAALVQHVRLGADTRGFYSNFSYFYYSESDQVLVAHQAAHSALFEFLDKYPRRVLVPHRLVPYPPAIVELLNRSTSQPHSRVFHSKVLNDFGHAGQGSISAKEMFMASRGWLSSGEATSSGAAAPNWETNKCCLPRQNCEQRGDWVAPADPSLAFMEVHGLPVALGNANFKAERFRPCTLSPLGGLCP